MSLRAALHAVRDAGDWLVDHDAKPLALPSRGLEAVIAGGFLGLETQDWVVPGLRERAGAVLRGCSVERLVDAGAGARPYRIVPVTAHPAARMLHACGIAMALRDTDKHVLCFLGQGSASYGAFHEALNLAALHRLNVIFLCAHWDLEDDESPLAPQIAGSLSAHALGYGLSVDSFDGGLVTEVLSAVTDARAHAGPHFLEARLTRGDDPLRRAYDELTETPPSISANAS